MFTIDDYFGRVFVFRLQETIKKKLNGFERFAVAPDQAPAFLGVDLQNQIVGFISRFLDFDDEAEVAQYCIEQFFGRHHLRFAAGATFSSVGIGCFLV